MLIFEHFILGNVFITKFRNVNFNFVCNCLVFNLVFYVQILQGANAYCVFCLAHDDPRVLLGRVLDQRLARAHPATIHTHPQCDRTGEQLCPHDRSTALRQVWMHSSVNSLKTGRRPYDRSRIYLGEHVL